MSELIDLGLAKLLMKISFQAMLEKKRKAEERVKRAQMQREAQEKEKMEKVEKLLKAKQVNWNYFFVILYRRSVTHCVSTNFFFLSNLIDWVGDEKSHFRFSHPVICHIISISLHTI